MQITSINENYLLFSKLEIHEEVLLSVGINKPTCKMVQVKRTKKDH